MSQFDALAENVASRAKSGQKIGIGTGRTADAVIQRLAKRATSEKLDIVVVPTSLQSTWAARQLGLQTLDPAIQDQLDWGFDGADAVDANCWLIKGKGGALLQEKIVAKRCKEFVVVVDEGKLTDNLGSKCAVPVEIIPSARKIAESALLSLGAKELTLREGSGKHGPVITEAGNIIVDALFQNIEKGLERELKSIVGVVESGLFIGYTKEVLVAEASGKLRTLSPK